ncbi:hypothetical protein KFL_000470300 [Klebsormidium nitens]|uniref:Transferase n=1 Tax=Klebsormidium nitens TaxID=105231 RepID=A0A1Y1HUE4_KLENI|nr:hypothetical protein KFL_000470300 [Klebsormidium nitens]|eukprot:GAQ80157.1 hypothetical protein KFL_000470300 [Klebsormidium nitens]
MAVEPHKAAAASLGLPVLRLRQVAAIQLHFFCGQHCTACVLFLEPPKPWQFVSDLDVIQVPYHIPVIFVYRSGGSSKGAEVSPLTGSGLPTTALLKESLARTLAAFYPLGGRIGSSNGRPVAYGFNDGVPFIESECNLEIPSDLQPSQFSSELLATPTPGIGGTPQGVPVMSVKVTRFRCGGLVLGVSFHHQIVDAAAFFTFMGAWAGVARGKSPASPSLNRTVLIGRDERTNGGLENGGPQPSSLWGSAFATWQKHASFWRAYADLRWRSLGQKEGLLRVTFTREEVAWLKRAANEKSSQSWDPSQSTATPGCDWASSDDAVCAHIWQRITRARALPADTTVTFDRHVDMRSRLDSPLPSDYIGSGNAGPPRLSISAGELLNKTLGQVAQRLRRELLQMGESYLNALLRKFRSMPFVPHFLARASPFGTAWWRSSKHLKGTEAWTSSCFFKRSTWRGFERIQSYTPPSQPDPERPSSSEEAATAPATAGAG